MSLLYSTLAIGLAPIHPSWGFAAHSGQQPQAAQRWSGPPSCPCQNVCLSGPDRWPQLALLVSCNGHVCPGALGGNCWPQSLVHFLLPHRVIWQSGRQPFAVHRRNRRLSQGLNGCLISIAWPRCINISVPLPSTIPRDASAQASLHSGM